jgi:outer membrane protein assembly factor BamB
MSSLSLAVLALTISAPAAKNSATDGDWPQWQGPNRDGHSASKGLLQKWPEGGPKLLYKIDTIGGGYGSPSIVAGRMYIVGTENLSKDKPDGLTALVFCLDPLTGKEIWKTPISDVKGDFNRGGAPRGSPTVDGDMLYVVEPKGEIFCLSTADGKKIWSKSLVKDMGGGVPIWGYSESVLIDGDKLICTPGGGKGALAALDKKTGKILWQCDKIKDGAGYSSAILVEVEGVKQYIQQSMQGTFGVSTDGKLLWNVPNPAYKIAVCPTPVFYENHVFATAGYGAGCKLIKLAKSPDGIKATEVYTSKTNKVLSNHHGGVVRVGEYLYGHSDKDWVCLKFITAPQKEGDDPTTEWNSKKQEKGSVSYADGCLYTYGETKGDVVLVKADPKDWIEVGRFTIPEKSQYRRKFSDGGIWAHPVIANGKLYLREYEWLFCYDVAAKE